VKDLDHFTGWHKRVLNVALCWTNRIFPSCKMEFSPTSSTSLTFVSSFDIHGSVHRRWLSRNTNKMQFRNRIYYSKVYWRLNMFRAAHPSSSGALNCIYSLWFMYTCGDQQMSRLGLDKTLEFFGGQVAWCSKAFIFFPNTANRCPLGSCCVDASRRITAFRRNLATLFLCTYIFINRT